MMRPIHLRMARAALNLTVRDLAARAGVNKNTISRYEAGNDIISSALQSIERTLVQEGVIFFEDHSQFGTGIRIMTKIPRLSKPTSADAKMQTSSRIKKEPRS
jgi:transcriptional regulator with XRE-family HTH domain